MQSFVFLHTSSNKEYLFAVQRPFHKQHLAQKPILLAFLSMIFFTSVSSNSVYACLFVCSFFCP